MPRTATIGPEIFQRVNTLVAEGKSRTEAFAQVGGERKSRPGTVAANYYRVARAQGQTRSRRKASTKRAPSSAPPSGRSARSGRRGTGRTSMAASDGDIRQISQQIADLTAQLVRLVEERDERIRSLVS